jgi:Family of unknown function (DUF5767)
MDILPDSSPVVLTLSEGEQRLMDDISFSPPEKSIPVRKPAPVRPLRSKPVPQPRVMDDEGLDMFTNPNKRTEQEPPGPEFWNGGEEEMPEEQHPMGGGQQVPSEGYKTIEDEKADLLNKIARLAKKGLHTSNRLSSYSDIEEIRTEYKRLTYAIDAERAIRFQKRMLIACVSGLEFLNKRFDPFDLQLDGWSENVMENQDDYDGVFEELYQKYNAKVNVAPEVKLIMMVGGSAMMFHLTNSMFKSAMPDMNKVLKQNPDLVKNMVDAVQRTQAGGNASTAGPQQREMRGPGLDLSSLMGGIIGPPPPIGTREPGPRDKPQEEDAISDIVSVDLGSDTKEVSVKKPRKSSKKKEVTL